MQDEDQLDRFAVSFQQFLEHVNKRSHGEDPGPPLLARRISEFLGDSPERMSICRAEFARRDLPSIQLAVETLVGHDGWRADLLGYTVEHDMGIGISKVLAPARWDPIREGPPIHVSVELPARTVSCLVQGLYLVTSPRARVALLQHVERGYQHELVRVETASCDKDAAADVLRRVNELTRSVDVLKGHVISLGANEATDVSFHQISPVTRDELILPEDVLTSLEKATLAMAEHSDNLREAGRHLQRGLLFHGPPGTGKSLAVKYLISQMPGRTVILLTGRVMGLIKMSCELARQLAPSTVVLEDVDLVAEDRMNEPQCAPLLFELMNEMDGLPGDADIQFLLTTNRPQALEPALASRPGRVDQAIEFPLPDAHCRKRLFELYARGLDAQAVDFDVIVGRTAGVSPAFIKELLRRAALNAAIRSPDERIAITDDDLNHALRDIVLSGGALSSRLLGADATAKLAG